MYVVHTHVVTYYIILILAIFPFLACVWFLKIVSVQTSVCVFVCVCPPPRLLITSGVMWRDMDPYDWLNKFYSCYMVTVVVIVNGRGLGIVTRRTH